MRAAARDRRPNAMPAWRHPVQHWNVAMLSGTAFSLSWQSVNLGRSDVATDGSHA